MNSEISDEKLHAFIDGELDAAESEALIAAMRGDAALAARVCTFRNLQAMVRVAYAEPPVARATRTSPLPSRVGRAALAGLVLAVGASAGWAVRGLEPTALAVGAETGGDSYQPVRLTQAADANQVILHLDSAAPQKMQAVLDEAERLLDEAERQGRVMQLEVIANSRGLDLLRVDVSPHAERMARMRARHANLQWVACGQSVARFVSEGQKVELLPATRTAPSAIGQIVTRLQQGWTYIRV